jgi:histidinol phosphatase-like enzyme
MLNASIDSATGEITHYHIVIFKNQDGRMTMLLSKPVLREIDISEYVVGEREDVDVS